MDLDEDISNPIRAYVVLKGRGGSIASGKGISSGNIQEYTSSPSVQEYVRNSLERLGFSVQNVSPLSIIVEAPQEKFETVFHGRLRAVRHPYQPSMIWNWSESPRIPDELSDKVETVIFPQPVKTHI